MKNFLYSFLFIFPGFFLPKYSLSQFAHIDTNQIQSLIDSCANVQSYKEALNCYNNGLLYISQFILAVKEKKEKKFLQESEITIYRKIGNIYRDELSALPKALEYYQKSLKKAEEINFKKGIAVAQFSIGNVYQDLSDNGKALDYFQKGLKMFEVIGDKKGIGLCLTGIGLVLNEQSQYKKALEYFNKSKKMFEDIKDENNISTTLINIAYSHEQLNDNASALADYQKSLELCKQIGDSAGIGVSLAGIGNVYQRTDIKKAEQYYSQALQIAKQFQDLTNEKENLNALKEVYRKQKKYKEALDLYDNYISVRDSISSQQNNKEIAKMEMQSDFEKKEAVAKAEHEKQIAIEEEKNKKQRVIIFSVVIGLLLVVIFSIFILNRWRVTQRQKKIIEIQKEEVDKQRELADSRRIIAEEQKYVIETQKTEVEKQKKLVEDHQKEIIDSITYAKRLQEAILPPLDFVKKHLPDSFILYKPKDIVAGDFYWMEELDNTIFIAAADCTGHGVPGAMVSVVCCNAINRTVKEFGLRETGKILDKVTELVLETFEKSGEDVKDGMDISLMAIHKTNKQINWSGANNPLLYFSNGEAIEIAADKQPVGKHDNRKPFTTNTISYLPDTTFYLFTDGYADQFGGPKGKKFMYKKMQAKLLEVSNKPMNEQKKNLDETITEWKGSTEQVDDICIIGIKI